MHLFFSLLCFLLCLHLRDGLWSTFNLEMLLLYVQAGSAKEDKWRDICIKRTTISNFSINPGFVPLHIPIKKQHQMPHLIPYEHKINKSCDARLRSAPKTNSPKALFLFMPWRHLQQLLTPCSEFVVIVVTNQKRPRRKCNLLCRHKLRQVSLCDNRL